MSKIKHLKGLAAAIGILVLIFDTETGANGIQEGIELCLKALIPSLFPLVVCSTYLTGNLQKLPWLRPLGIFCGIPEGTETLLITGLLGGYPIGAQNITIAWRQGTLSKTDAQQMLAFCNNAGPAFLFGIVAASFDHKWIPWVLWCIHITAALITSASLPRQAKQTVSKNIENHISLPQTLKKSILVMSQICGWVLLFRMMLNYFQKWFLHMLPGAAQVLLIGLLELSNGCLLLPALESEGLRMIVASALLAMGGLCVTLQTISVTEGLSLRYYFPGKVLQASVSILMAVAMQFFLPPAQRFPLHPGWMAVITGVAVISTLFLGKTEKNSSIPVVIGV